MVVSTRTSGSEKVQRSREDWGLSRAAVVIRRADVQAGRRADELRARRKGVQAKDWLSGR
eukprot:554159-Pleurochrysis_carterae.AAC.2